MSFIVGIRTMWPFKKKEPKVPLQRGIGHLTYWKRYNRKQTEMSAVCEVEKVRDVGNDYCEVRIITISNEDFKGSKCLVKKSSVNWIN